MWNGVHPLETTSFLGSSVLTRKQGTIGQRLLRNKHYVKCWLLLLLSFKIFKNCFLPLWAISAHQKVTGGSVAACWCHVFRIPELRLQLPQRRGSGERDKCRFLNPGLRLQGCVLEFTAAEVVALLVGLFYEYRVWGVIPGGVAHSASPTIVLD